jgi:hypothetical protein
MKIIERPRGGLKSLKSFGQLIDGSIDPAAVTQLGSPPADTSSDFEQVRLGAPELGCQGADWLIPSTDTPHLTESELHEKFPSKLHSPIRFEGLHSCYTYSRRTLGLSV